MRKGKRGLPPLKEDELLAMANIQRGKKPPFGFKPTELQRERLNRFQRDGVKVVEYEQNEDYTPDRFKLLSLQAKGYHLYVSKGDDDTLSRSMEGYDTAFGVIVSKKPIKSSRLRKLTIDKDEGWLDVEGIEL